MGNYLQLLSCRHWCRRSQVQLIPDCWLQFMRIAVNTIYSHITCKICKFDLFHLDCHPCGWSM
jgi:hypothetical protein